MAWMFKDEQTENAFYERAYAKVNIIGWHEEEQLEYISQYIDEYFDIFEMLSRYPQSGNSLSSRIRKFPKPSGKDRGSVVIYEIDASENVIVLAVTSFLLPVFYRGEKPGLGSEANIL